MSQAEPQKQDELEAFKTSFKQLTANIESIRDHYGLEDQEIIDAIILLRERMTSGNISLEEDMAKIRDITAYDEPARAGYFNRLIDMITPSNLQLSYEPTIAQIIAYVGGYDFVAAISVNQTLSSYITSNAVIGQLLGGSRQILVSLLDFNYAKCDLLSTRCDKIRKYIQASKQASKQNAYNFRPVWIEMMDGIITTIDPGQLYEYLLFESIRQTLDMVHCLYDEKHDKKANVYNNIVMETIIYYILSHMLLVYSDLRTRYGVLTEIFNSVFSACFGLVVLLVNFHYQAQNQELNSGEHKYILLNYIHAFLKPYSLSELDFNKAIVIKKRLFYLKEDKNISINILTDMLLGKIIDLIHNNREIP
jgi:hypothetical protein